MHGDVKAIFSLYRSCLRAVNRLPTEYLRQFFRLKVRDDVRDVLSPKVKCTKGNKIRRVVNDLRKLQGANDGHVSQFQYVLDTAYGRRGPLKWELFQSLRTAPGQDPPPPIIPSVESSRPPVWSPEMVALLTSDYSRTTGKALRRSWLELPPSIPPERLDPKSREYRVLGPLSKRREVNIRRRFFAKEVLKVLYPLELTVDSTAAPGVSSVTRTDKTSVVQAQARNIGLQGAGLLEEVEALACPPALAELGSATSKRGSAVTRDSVRPTIDSHLPRRFLRRRFQHLLSRTPILVYASTQAPHGASSKGSAPPPKLQHAELNNLGVKPGQFKVTLSPNALGRNSPVTAVADDVDMAWIALAEEHGGVRSK